MISPITVWELARKASLGQLPKLPTIDGSFAAWLSQCGFVGRNLSWADAERANELPPLHKDPMDRMLIAQALNAGLKAVTEDGMYQAYGVSVVW